MAQYIHGTSEKEQERLSLLNRITNDSFMKYLGDLSGKDVCDFGCGMGDLIAEIAARCPDAKITGLEISEDQIELSFEPEIYTEDDPEGYRAWLENAAGIILGVRGELVGHRMIEPETVDAVLSEMERRIGRPAGVALFYWNRAMVKKGGA